MFLTTLVALALAQNSNAQILAEIRQSSKEEKFDAILPLVQKLSPLNEADAQTAAGLVNGTLVMQLEPKNRPLMLKVIRASLEKAPLSDPQNPLHCQIRETEARVLEVLGEHKAAMDTLDKTIAVSKFGKSYLFRLRDHLALVGTPAAPVTFKEHVGEFPGIDAWKGKVVVIDFFAHWCGPCIAEFPEIKAIYKDHKSDGLEILGATEFFGFMGEKKNLSKTDEFEGMKGFLKDKDLPWPVVFTDPTVKKAYGQLGLPNVIVIDRKGTIREVGYGFYPGEPGKLRKLVEDLLKERN